MVRQIRQPHHAAAEALETVLVLVVLRDGARVVNRLTRQMRQLAPIDRMRHRARQR